MMKHVQSFNPSVRGGAFSDIYHSIIAQISVEGTLIESLQPVKARPADRMVCNEVVRCVAHRRTRRLGAGETERLHQADQVSYGRHLKRWAAPLSNELLAFFKKNLFFFLRGPLRVKYCLRAGPGFYFNATFSASLSVLQYHFCVVCLRGISRSRCPRNCCANTDNAESYVCGLFSFRLARSIKRDLSNNLNFFHFSSPSPAKNNRVLSTLPLML